MKDESGTNHKDKEQLRLSRLMEREATLRAITTLAKDPILVMDNDGKIVFMNVAAENFLGWKRDEAVGKVLHELLAPERYHDDYRRGFPGFRKQGTGNVVDKTIELNARRKDGTEIPIELSVSAVELDGKWHAVGILRDISERKRIEGELWEAHNELELKVRERTSELTDIIEALRLEIRDREHAEEELRRSRHEWMAIFQAIGNPTVILDPDHRIISANRAVVKATGMPEPDIIGKKCYEIFHGMGAAGPAPCCPMEALLLTGDMETVEMEMESLGGTFIVSCTPIFDEKKRLLKVIHIATDITEHKRMEEELRESGEKYRTLVETTNTGYVILDGKGFVLDANDEYVRLTGRREIAEVLGRNVLEWTAPHDLERNAVEVRKCFAQGFVRNLEVDYVGPSGAIIPIEINATTVESRDGIRIVTLCRDIASRRKTEEELERYRLRLEELVAERTRRLVETRQKLIDSERLAVLGQFAGSLAHEIRNPLGAIAGFAYLLKQKLPAGDAKTQLYLDKIDGQVGRSIGIIESVLNLTRMSPPSYSPMDAAEWLRDECAAVRAPENIRVQCEAPRGPLPIMADKKQLGIMFKNLVLNALESMPGGGKLTVLAQQVREEGADFVEVIVADTGCGISPESLEQIFQPLFTTKAKGIGFGLPIVKLIAEKHGGGIRAESAPGRGTAFTLRLPLSLKEQES